MHIEHLRAFASTRSYTADPPEPLHEVRKPAPPPLVHPPADNYLPEEYCSDDIVPAEATATSGVSHESRTPQAVRRSTRSNRGQAAARLNL